MDEKQLADIMRLAQRQGQQIRQLVNLLLGILDGKPDSDIEVMKYLIETELYKLIDAEGDAGLWHEQIRNKFRRKIVEAELRRYE